MKHIITCSNVKCKHNNGYNKCYLKVIGITDKGCGSFVLSDQYNPNARIIKVRDEIDEYTNMC